MFATLTVMNRAIKNTGFTLIELVIVIAVIGILATISLIGFGRFQADTRDARRSSSANVIVEALEKYYDLNGEYPSCSALTSGTVIKDTLQGVDTKTLVAPQASSGTVNSIQCTSAGSVLTTDGIDFFEYQGDGSLDCNGNVSCVNYTIKFKDETNGQIKTIASRRQTQIASQGSITITSNSVSFTSFNLAWTTISNASSYTLQQASDAGFTSAVVESSEPIASVSMSGKNTGTTYFYRVRANGGINQTTDWSQTLSVQTLALGTPTITSIATANTSLTPTWTAATNATSYRVQYATTSTFTSPVTNDILSTSFTTPATLDQGRIYYFRVYALNGVNTGSASATSPMNTTIATPSAPNIAIPTNVDYTTYYYTTYNWSPASACPVNTIAQYQYQFTMNNAANYTSVMSSATVGTSFIISTSEGYTYTTYVNARCRSSSTTTIVSNWSGASARGFYQPVNGPTAIAWSASRNSDRSIALNVTATCRAGSYYFGNFDEYTRDIVWTSGPNSGNTGWYTPGGYRTTNIFYPSGGITNAYAIPNGTFYSARAYVVCRNSETGAQGGGADVQAPGWTWGSNI